MLRKMVKSAKAATRVTHHRPARHNRRTVKTQKAGAKNESKPIEILEVDLIGPLETIVELEEPEVEDAEEFAYDTL